SGAGSEVMSRIAAPMIGGMLTALILAIFYIPLFFVLVRRGVRDALKALRERRARKREAQA
ncbi:efflux RND transporter permease subunit, partial [Escherichia coli]|nr:efflux RND transporter permease subunit [Escherichia coli]